MSVISGEKTLLTLADVKILAEVKLILKALRDL